MKNKVIHAISLIIICLLLIIFPGKSNAGPNSPAGCALDLDYATRNYDSGITSKDIDTTVDANTNDEIWIAVVAQNVTNLDTYQVEADFDASRMTFLGGYEENALGGVSNLLKTNGGTTVGFQAVENVPGTVNIANALTGNDANQAPEGSGIIALLNFRILDGNNDNQLILSNVHFLDSGGTNDPINNLMNAMVNPSLVVFSDGDVAPLGNRDGIVNTGDGLVALRFALGLETITQGDRKHGDVAPLGVNGKPKPDGKITVGDGLVILRKALGIIEF